MGKVAIQAITPEEAHERILFLSAGLALTEDQMTSRWPKWHREMAKARREFGVDSAGFLLWRCRFAKPAYVALGFAEA